MIDLEFLPSGDLFSPSKAVVKNNQPATGWKTNFFMYKIQGSCDFASVEAWTKKNHKKKNFSFLYLDPHEDIIDNRLGLGWNELLLRC